MAEIDLNKYLAMKEALTIAVNALEVIKAKGCSMSCECQSCNAHEALFEINKLIRGLEGEESIYTKARREFQAKFDAVANELEKK